MWLAEPQPRTGLPGNRSSGGAKHVGCRRVALRKAALVDDGVEPRFFYGLDWFRPAKGGVTPLVVIGEKPSKNLADQARITGWWKFHHSTPLRMRSSAANIPGRPFRLIPMSLTRACCAASAGQFVSYGIPEKGDGTVDLDHQGSFHGEPLMLERCTAC